jgi:hypothetical protein
MEDQPKSALTQQTPTSSPSGESVQPMPIRSDADELWGCVYTAARDSRLLSARIAGSYRNTDGPDFQPPFHSEQTSGRCLYFVGGLRPSVVAFVECGLPWDKSLTSIAAFFQHRDPIGM